MPSFGRDQDTPIGLESDLQRCEEWAEEHGAVFEADKSKLMDVTRKRNADTTSMQLDKIIHSKATTKCKVPRSLVKKETNKTDGPF